MCLSAPGYPRLVMAAWLWLSLSQELLPARVEPARAPEEHLTNAAWNLCHQDRVWRAVCAWGSQAAALPSLLTQAAENVLRRFHCCVCCP